MFLDEYPAVPSSIAERYKVGRTLGDGNFAVVRECMERSTGREYALKIINKDKCRGKVRALARVVLRTDWVFVHVLEEIVWLSGNAAHQSISSSSLPVRPLCIFTLGFDRVAVSNRST